MEFELPHDPNILVGMINMKLRDFYDSLEALCDDMDLDKQDLENRLNIAGFKYDAKCNQYHAE